MRTAVGLERLLLSESNVSDLIQFFASEDPEPLAGLLGVDFDDVRRESLMGAKRADLVLRRAGRPVAAIELKVAHAFSDEQRKAYESWASVNGAPVLVLSSLDSAPLDLPPGWKHHPLKTVFRAWTLSRKSFVPSLAMRVTDVLERWNKVVEGVDKPMTEAGALTFDDIDDVALLRVVSRELAVALHAAGWAARAGVSSGGGNPLVQSWEQVKGVEDVWFIADARFEENRVHLRFGVDGGPGTAEEVWRVAQALDDAITVDALVTFIDGTSNERSSTLPRFEAGGRGRPRARGDWNAVVLAGKKAAGANPGFLRDGLTRLECGGRILKSDLNSWSLKLLLEAVHDHLRAAWAALAADAGARP